MHNRWCIFCWMHIQYVSATLSLSVSTVVCLSVCHVCVHWGWGMWVGKILKMESFFVGAVLWLDSWGRWGNTPHFTWSLFPGVVRTSHLSNQQVNHCGAAVHQSTERQFQTAMSPHHPFSHIPKKNCTIVFTHCQFLWFFKKKQHQTNMYLIW